MHLENIPPLNALLGLCRSLVLPVIPSLLLVCLVPDHMMTNSLREQGLLIPKQKTIRQKVFLLRGQSCHVLSVRRSFMAYASAQSLIKKQNKIIYQHRLCFICLRKGHMIKDCRTKHICGECGRRHPTCLHEDRERQSESVTNGFPVPTER